MDGRRVIGWETCKFPVSPLVAAWLLLSGGVLLPAAELLPASELVSAAAEVEDEEDAPDDCSVGVEDPQAATTSVNAANPATAVAIRPTRRCR
jgi:hypothetical protein